MFEDGKAFSYYILIGKEKVTLISQYEKFDPERHKTLLETRPPQKMVLHTLKTSIQGEQKMSFPRPGTAHAGAGLDELYQKYLYVMRDSRLLSYPSQYEKGEGKVHASGFSGKDIEAAGMLAAKAGKIIAIDNQSGHYQPNSAFLLQAVQEINNHDAFDSKALVGVAFKFVRMGFSNMFFPVSVFVKLASAGLPMADTWQALLDMKTRYPAGPESFPHGETDIYYRFKGNWIKGCGADDFDDLPKSPLEAWDRRILGFMKYMYGEAFENIYVSLRSLSSSKGKRLSWPLKTFKKKTYLWTKMGIPKAKSFRDSLENVDKALKAYDQQFVSFKSRIGEKNMNVTGIMIQAGWLTEKADKLLNVISAWDQFNKKASKIGRDRVQELQKSVKKESEGFRALVRIPSVRAKFSQG